MSQLVISDLNFCETEFTAQSEVKGGKLVDIAVGVVVQTLLSQAFVGVGGGVGVALAVGGNPIANVGIVVGNLP